MRIVLPLAVAAVVSGLVLAQGSKPMPADAATKAPASSLKARLASPTPVTRTVSGRPADLDPRIPWLEDLGIPQSGGPEPLVPVAEVAISGVSTLTSLAEADGTLVIMENEWILRCLNVNGTTKWSKMLPGPGRWQVLVSGSHILAVPMAVTKAENSRIHMYSIAGDEEGTFLWDLKPKLEYLAEIASEGGVVVGNTTRGRRTYARIGPKSTVEPDSIVTEGDVNFGGDYSDAEVRGKDRQGYAVLGAMPFPDNTKDREAKMSLRRRRSKRWQGHTLKIRDLPYYRHEENPGLGDWDKPGLKGWNVLRLAEDGSVWVEVGISNPFGYPKSVLLDKDSSVTKGIPMIALFGPGGVLRGYVLIRPPMGNPIVPVRGALYIRTGDRLVRWEPVRR